MDRGISDAGGFDAARAGTEGVIAAGGFDAARAGTEGVIAAGAFDAARAGVEAGAGTDGGAAIPMSVFCVGCGRDPGGTEPPADVDAGPPFEDLVDGGFDPFPPSGALESRVARSSLMAVFTDSSSDNGLAVE
jgi:hypothetical protein